MQLSMSPGVRAARPGPILPVSTVPGHEISIKLVCLFVCPGHAPLLRFLKLVCVCPGRAAGSSSMVKTGPLADSRDRNAALDFVLTSTNQRGKNIIAVNLCVRGVLSILIEVSTTTLA
jgi:hypothetical protein